MPHSRTSWQLPPGVARGSWDYVESPRIAADYDEYFVGTPLFDFDEAVLAEHIQPPARVADLGCGTGRALLPLVRRGCRGLAVDLSDSMLRIVQEKAELEGLPVACLLANLVELDCLAAESVDHAICLFSTLGMIRGAEHRLRFLRHVRRILRPGGVFVLHVHNYWYNLYDPDGPWWLLGNWWQSLWDREIEAGDKYFPYRGVPTMFLHVFTEGELLGALREAGFELLDFIHLDPQRCGPLPWPWLVGSLRANGWIAVVRGA